ncbi:apolipoprotein B receptor [Sorex araneus]|uniref:apolipoprotein B receptor n=1 Tax=Sorex araneus TaxID=42254 RepID=UPI002433615F|nr:apolipoprotein B receptor [Sorex araneus]
MDFLRLHLPGLHQALRGALDSLSTFISYLMGDEVPTAGRSEGTGEAAAGKRGKIVEEEAQEALEGLGCSQSQGEGEPGGPEEPGRCQEGDSAAEQTRGRGEGESHGAQADRQDTGAQEAAKASGCQKLSAPLEVLKDSEAESGAERDGSSQVSREREAKRGETPRTWEEEEAWPGGPGLAGGVESEWAWHREPEGKGCADSPRVPGEGPESEQAGAEEGWIKAGREELGTSSDREEIWIATGTQEDGTASGEEKGRAASGGEETRTTSGGEEAWTAAGPEEACTDSGGEEAGRTSDIEEACTTSSREETCTASGIVEACAASGREEACTALGREEAWINPREPEGEADAEAAPGAQPETPPGERSEEEAGADQPVLPETPENQPPELMRGEEGEGSPERRAPEAEEMTWTAHAEAADPQDPEDAGVQEDEGPWQRSEAVPGPRGEAEGCAEGDEAHGCWTEALLPASRLDVSVSRSRALLSRNASQRRSRPSFRRPPAQETQGEPPSPPRQEGDSVPQQSLLQLEEPPQPSAPRPEGTPVPARRRPLGQGFGLAHPGMMQELQARLGQPKPQ